MTLPRNRTAAVRRLCALLADRLFLAGKPLPHMPQGRYETVLWCRWARRVLGEARS